MNKDEREALIESLREVRESGAVNMMLKSDVVYELYEMGKDWSAEQISSMDGKTYISLLEEI